MAKIDVDIVIPTLNEERAIRQCIESVVDHFTRVHVVDSRSSDRTQQIAQSLGAHVVNFAWDSQYPKKKQWALENLKFASEWVLFLDADERVGPQLLDEIRNLDLTSGPAAYDISLDYWWRGRLLRYGQTVHKRALVDVKRVRFPPIDDLGAPGMGEQEGHYQPLVLGSVGRLQSRLQHDDPDPLHSWFARHNRYSDWEAYLRTNPLVRRQVEHLRSSQGRVLERLPAKPLAVFIYNYVAKSGWRDGTAGLEYALALAFYQFQISVKVRERRDNWPGAARSK